MKRLDTTGINPVIKRSHGDGTPIVGSTIGTNEGAVSERRPELALDNG
jgi:hypothetical protein